MSSFGPTLGSATSSLPGASAPVNAAPTAPGTIAGISGTAGVAITPVDVHAAFSDTDALTYSASPAGTAWPTGLVINGSTGVISGTVATAATTSGLKVRATDTASQTVDSNAFSATISAAVSTVTGVTVTPGTATGSRTFTASVAGTNSPSQAVTWSASAGSITSGGVFTQPAATGSVQTITVTATSVQDGTKSGAATVTIAALVPTVTSVTVSPGTATGSQTFTASVVGTNSPSQSVTWATTGGSITSGGVFTQPAATGSAQTITVTATSTFDGTKSGTANVTIAAALATTVTFAVKDIISGADITGITGWDFAIFDQPRPKDALAPIKKGAVAAVSAGVATFDITGLTALTLGQLCLVMLMSPDGTKAIFGQTAVS